MEPNKGKTSELLRQIGKDLSALLVKLKELEDLLSPPSVDEERISCIDGVSPCIPGKGCDGCGG